MSEMKAHNWAEGLDEDIWESFSEGVKTLGVLLCVWRQKERVFKQEEMACAKGL